MEIVTCPDRARAVALTARLIESRLRARPEIVLGLATGRTMEGVYAHLVRSGASFARATTFNLDEYVGLPPEDPNAYAAYMRHHLFDRVEIDPMRTHLLDGMAADLAGAAAAYEARIAAAGGIDLQLLGIGETGHIGFNEPLSALTSRTRPVVLTPTTRRQNAGLFDGDPDAVPARALTMGVGTILESRELILLACGTAKAEILARAVEGPLTARISASALQMHPSCTIVADAAAASALEDRAYYDAVCRTEESWAPYRDLL